MKGKIKGKIIGHDQGDYFISGVDGKRYDFVCERGYH